MQPEAPRRPLLSLFVAALLPTAAVACVLAALRDRPKLVAVADGDLLRADGWRGLGAANLEWMFETTRGGERRPLAWLSLAADHVLGDGSAARLHDTNLALHALCAALVGALVLVLLRRTGAAATWPRTAPVVAALAATAWAVHPLRVEPVASVAERSTLLCTAFALLATCAWTSAIGSTSLRRLPYALAIAAAVGAALASPASVAWVPAWWLLARWLARTCPSSRAAGETGRLVAGIAAAPVLAAVATWAVRAPDGATTAGAAILGFAHAVLAPLWDTFVPSGATPFRDVQPPGDIDPRALQAGLLAMLALGAAPRVARRAGGSSALVACFAFAAVAYLLGHAPAGADAQTYAATIPLYVAAGVWFGDGAGCLLAFVGLPAIALTTALPASIAMDRAASWSSDATLAEAVLAEDPWNDRVNASLALSAWSAGATAEAERRALRALAATGPRPRSTVALAVVRGGAGTGADGRTLASAAEAAPWLPDVWRELAFEHGRAGRTAEAAEAMQRAVRLDPDDGALWFALGRARLASGDRGGAADAFRRALDLDPLDGRVREELERLR